MVFFIETLKRRRRGSRPGSGPSFWAKTPHAGDAVEPITPEQVEAELARRPLLRLRFPSVIEKRYENDNQAARAWTIRLTVPLGLIAYVAFVFVDDNILPDLGWVPAALRIGVVGPLAVYAMWMCTRCSARFRETFLGLAMTGTLLLPVGFIAMSRAPLAPYTMLVVLLVSNFGNIVLRLRFYWACFSPS